MGENNNNSDSQKWQVPQEAKDKIPQAWGKGKPNRKEEGWRWKDPQNLGNGIRIDKGNPNHSLPSQQVDHVIIRQNGCVIGRDGKTIKGSIKNDPVNAHIPLKDWLTWTKWNCP